MPLIARRASIAGTVATARPDRGPRILIYSHDTFGLGHLRRSRTIANALAESDPGRRVLIVSGSPVVDRYAYAEGVTSIRLPAVTKRPDGSYASRDPDVPLDETVAARSRLIARAAEAFRPDLILVDKEPSGFHGEMLPTLETWQARGSRLVLGLRDVLDEPERLAREWARKDAFAATETFFDEIWIYGVPRLYEPLAGMPLSTEVARRTVYTGYLRRQMPDADTEAPKPAMTQNPFLLVTPGGGGDGEGLVDWVIAAYEHDPGIPLPALIAFGPFMTDDNRRAFLERIGRLGGRIAAIDFDSKIERLMLRASGIVAMGGYNTFCEILSFDARAILVPRAEPRREQQIRALAAESLGLARVLLEEDGRAPERMAAALRALPEQPLPSRVVVPGLLDGLASVGERVRALTAPQAPPLARAACL